MSIRFIDSSGRYQLPRNLNNVSFPKYASDQELIDWYNEYSDSSKKLTKFPNRSEAEEKCSKLKQALDWLAMSAQSTKRENKVMAAKKTKTANAKAAKGKKAAAKSKSNGSTRKFALLDHTLQKVAKENPRRKGTHGHKTWEVIKNGMTYRDAIDAGARNKDIRHDINKGNLKLNPPKGEAAKAKSNGNGKAPKTPAKPKAKKGAKKTADVKPDKAEHGSTNVGVQASA